MYEKPFRLQIVTPVKIAYQGEATSLSAPGVLGGFQVLANHAPLLSAVEIGRMKVRDTAGAESHYASSSGFVEVRNNVVTVLVESAEKADEIDVQRARAARERAEKRLQAKSPEIDVARAQLALLRALNRLRVAGAV
jgi:F-type H+-transporting ATPase subunit epsilon